MWGEDDTRAIYYRDQERGRRVIGLLLWPSLRGLSFLCLDLS